MNKIEYKKLVKEYGNDLANKAVAWFVENGSESFRKHVYAAKFCIANEYLWR